MLPLRLKCEPVFDIKKDLDQIRKALRSKERRNVDPQIAAFPTSRAYVLTKGMEPVAIFDRLGPGFGGLIKLALSAWPEHIDNPKGYRDIEVMNALRKSINSSDFKRPYMVAVFMADSLCFHFPISPDLMVVICDRLKKLDIVNRDIWEFLFDSGAE